MSGIDLVLSILAIPAIASLVYLVYESARVKRIRAVESEFPTFLTSILEGLHSGEAIETALMAASTMSKGPIQGLTDRLLDRVTEGMEFSEALGMLGEDSNSRMIQRSVSMIRVAIEHGAELGETIEHVHTNVWEVYLLQLERRVLAAKEGKVLVMGGVIMTPVILGITFSMFSDVGMGGSMVTALLIYTAFFAFLSAVFYGVVSGQMRMALSMAPLFVFTGVLCFSVPFMGIGLFQVSMGLLLLLVPVLVIVAVLVIIVLYLRKKLRQIKEAGRKARMDDDMFDF